MKSVDKKKVKKPIKKKPLIKPKKEKVLIVAQEFKFAKLLSGNEKTTRDRVLKSLKKWLSSCFSKNYVFKEDDFIRVWKGLFYAVWMSDKPLIQEDLCESISHILDLFPNDQFKYAMMMTKVGFKVLGTEWYGIDQHRIDKFLMLVRRYLRGSFRCLSRKDWDSDACIAYANMLSSEDGVLAVKTPFYARNGISMILHIIECFLEELSKISKGKIPEECLTELLDPFIKQICIGEQHEVYTASRQLLTDLLKQSDLGLKYAGATQAWKNMGCPDGGPDAFELISDEEAEEDAKDYSTTNGPLDPRAGRVNVTLEPLPVPAQLVAQRIRQYMKKSASKAYKRANTCLQRFEKLSQDDYPLKIRTEEMELPLPKGNTVKSAVNLKLLEKSLVVGSDELALRGLSRKHRKRLLAKSRAGLSIMEDIPDIQTDENKEEKKSTTPDDKVKSRKRKNKDVVKPDKKPKLELKEDVKKETNKKVNKKNKENEQVDKSKSKVKVNKKDNVLVNKKENKNVIIPKNKTNEKTKAESKNDVKLDKKEPVAKAEKKDKKQNKKEEKTPVKTKSFAKAAKNVNVESPKKVKFVLKNNCKQETVDYYESIRQSPNIPFDSSKKPAKTNLKPSTPSPINPFFKKKLRLK
ncbi:unnamed protein product [Pieris brassicae]|uniref:Ribosomal RNA processing protein 1 homolog n=1 Tax=Pieris brassicae TaxID=7116 RepID=A0A9P0TKF7_PIEBR|nr:unnamed protein product [Pieris brassicae]